MVFLKSLSESIYKYEEFDMANEYIKEAVNELEVISQDEIKRMEYNARQKAIWDYNTLMEENFSRGILQGRADLLAKMAADGVPEEIIRKYM